MTVTPPLSDPASVLSTDLARSDGITHPVTLRVRGQEGDLIHANDGSVARMDYRVVPVSQAPPEWLGHR